MLLTHRTPTASILAALTDGYLRPASETKMRNENPYDVHLPFIFFTACPEDLDAIDINYAPTLFFDSSALYQHTFYTNHYHSSGIVASTKTYPKHYGHINMILNRLFKHSMSVTRSVTDDRSKFGMHVAFQEVFFRGRLSLKSLKYIKLPKNDDKCTLKIRVLVKKMYPQVFII
jgi:hypothetical protein